MKIMKIMKMGWFALLGLGMLPGVAGAHSLATAAQVAPAANPLVYYGGPVLSHVKVYVVFWGPSVDPTTVQGIPGFFDAITKSSMMDWLNQYKTAKQEIGKGSFGGSFTITPRNAAAQMTNTDVVHEIEAQIDQHVLPVPDADSLYMIYFPKGIVLSLADGSVSCQAWCGDHEGYASAKYGNIAYAMMPDLSSGTGCDIGCGGYGDTTFDSMTVISSHEMTEAVTDPMCPPMGQPNAFPAAWVTKDQQEIGDLCTGEPAEKITTSTTAYEIQQEWDNAKNACSAGPWGI